MNIVDELMADANVTLASFGIAAALYVIWVSSAEKRALADMAMGALGFTLLGASVFLGLRALTGGA